MRGGRADRYRPALLYTYIYGEASGSCRARLWGVCCCALRLRFLFFDRQGRGVLHTPYQTSPKRRRTPVPSSANNHPKATTRALWCPFVGRMQYAPTLTVDCIGSFHQPPLRLRFLFFDRQGRGVLHTPHQTSPARGRMRVPGYFAG